MMLQHHISTIVESATYVHVYPYNLEQEIKEAGFETEYVTECYGVAWKKSGL